MENIKETPLCKLAFKYGTDKCPRLKHVYTPFYYELFKNRRKTVKKVLEMGIDLGASLKMWQDFFPNAEIYGADINPDFLFDEGRIKTFLCDEDKESQLRQLIKKTGSDIDLFVDDAIHKPRRQIFLAQTILPLLDDGVIYIIEDVSHNKSISRLLSQYKCETPILKNRKHRAGKLVVIRK